MSVHTYSTGAHRTTNRGYSCLEVMKAGAKAFAAAITKAFPKDRSLVLVAPPMSGAVLAGATRIFLKHTDVKIIDPTRPNRYGYITSGCAVIWIDDCFNMCTQIIKYLDKKHCVPDLCCVLAADNSNPDGQYELDDWDARGEENYILPLKPFEKMANKGTLIYVANVHEDGPPVPFFV